MKILNKILIAATLFSAAACTEDTPITLPVDVVWTSYISTQNSDIWDENTIYVEPGDYLFLRDVSQGALSHEWIIDEKVSFFTTVDDTSTTIEDKTSTNLDAYILFEQSGWTTIKMRNTFAEEVTSNTSDSYAASITTYYDDEEGVWVFEKEWYVEIYGDLKPAFSVNKIALDGTQTEVLTVAGDEETSTDNLTEVTLSQGDKLQFIYDTDSEYKSTSQTWTVAGGTYNQSDDTYSYDTVGTYTGFTLKATRDAISTSATISAASVTKVVPLKVYVEYANIAVVSTGLYQESDFSIIVPFSKSLKTPIDDSLADAFSLSFVGDNGDVSQPITITSAAVSDDDSTVLVLTIDDSNYDNYARSHAILSYTPTEGAYIYDGSIEEGEPISGFSDLSVSLYDIFEEEYFNFNLPPESTNAGYVIGGWWINFTESSTTDNGSFIDAASDPTDSSNTAMQFYVNGVVGADQENYIVLACYDYETNETLTAGEYILRGRIYVKDFVALEGQTATANMQVVLSNGAILLCNVAIDDKQCGEWVEFDEVVSIDEGTTFSNFRLQMQYSGSSSDVTSLDYTEFYIDDLYLSPNYAE